MLPSAPKPDPVKTDVDAMTTNHAKTNNHVADHVSVTEKPTVGQTASTTTICPPTQQPRMLDTKSYLERMRYYHELGLVDQQGKPRTDRFQPLDLSQTRRKAESPLDLTVKTTRRCADTTADLEQLILTEAQRVNPLAMNLASRPLLSNGLCDSSQVPRNPRKEKLLAYKQQCGAEVPALVQVGGKAEVPVKLLNAYHTSSRRYLITADGLKAQNIGVRAVTPMARPVVVGGDVGGDGAVAVERAYDTHDGYKLLSKSIPGHDLLTYQNNNSAFGSYALLSPKSEHSLIGNGKPISTVTITRASSPDPVVGFKPIQPAPMPQRSTDVVVKPNKDMSLIAHHVQPSGEVPRNDAGAATIEINGHRGPETDPKKLSPSFGEMDTNSNFPIKIDVTAKNDVTKKGVVVGTNDVAKSNVTSKNSTRSDTQSKRSDVSARNEGKSCRTVNDNVPNTKKLSVSVKQISSEGLRKALKASPKSPKSSTNDSKPSPGKNSRNPSPEKRTGRKTPERRPSPEKKSTKKTPQREAQSKADKTSSDRNEDDVTDKVEKDKIIADKTDKRHSGEKCSVVKGEKSPDKGRKTPVDPTDNEEKKSSRKAPEKRSDRRSSPVKRSPADRKNAIDRKPENKCSTNTRLNGVMASEDSMSSSSDERTDKSSGRNTPNSRSGKKRSLLEKLNDGNGFILDQKRRKGPSSLDGDPSLLGREERMLRHALLRFGSLEAKSTSPEPLSDEKERKRKRERTDGEESPANRKSSSTASAAATSTAPSINTTGSGSNTSAGAGANRCSPSNRKWAQAAGATVGARSKPANTATTPVTDTANTTTTAPNDNRKLRGRPSDDEPTAPKAKKLRKTPTTRTKSRQRNDSVGNESDNGADDEQEVDTAAEEGEEEEEGDDDEDDTVAGEEEADEEDDDDDDVSDTEASPGDKSRRKLSKRTKIQRAKSDWKRRRVQQAKRWSNKNRRVNKMAAKRGTAAIVSDPGLDDSLADGETTMDGFGQELTEADELLMMRGEGTPSKRLLPPSDMRRLVVNKTSGETALHRAGRLGYEDVALYLLDTGAVDVNAKDNAGYTALHESCVKGNLNIVRHLVHFGADINAAAADGTRPIHDAVDNHQLEIVRMLLACGADPMLATYSGRTTFKLARIPKMKTFMKGFLCDLNQSAPEMGDESEAPPPWEFNGSSTATDAFDPLGHNIFADVPEEPPLDNDMEFEFYKVDPPCLYRVMLPNEDSAQDVILLNDLLDRLGLTRQKFMECHPKICIGVKRMKTSQFQQQCPKYKSTQGQMSPSQFTELLTFKEGVKELLSCQTLVIDYFSGEVFEDRGPDDDDLDAKSVASDSTVIYGDVVDDDDAVEVRTVTRALLSPTHRTELPQQQMTAAAAAGASGVISGGTLVDLPTRHDTVMNIINEKIDNAVKRDFAHDLSVSKAQAFVDSLPSPALPASLTGQHYKHANPQHQHPVQTNTSGQAAQVVSPYLHQPYRQQATDAYARLAPGGHVVTQPSAGSPRAASVSPASNPRPSFVAALGGAQATANYTAQSASQTLPNFRASYASAKPYPAAATYASSGLVGANFANTYPFKGGYPTNAYEPTRSGQLVRAESGRTPTLGTGYSSSPFLPVTSHSVSSQLPGSTYSARGYPENGHASNVLPYPGSYSVVSHTGHLSGGGHAASNAQRSGLHKQGGPQPATSLPGSSGVSISGAASGGGYMTNHLSGGSLYPTSYASKVLAQASTSQSSSSRSRERSHSGERSKSHMVAGSHYPGSYLPPGGGHVTSALVGAHHSAVGLTGHVADNPAPAVHPGYVDLTHDSRSDSRSASIRSSPNTDLLSRSGDRSADLLGRSGDRSADLMGRSGERSADLMGRSGERSADLMGRSGDRSADLMGRSGDRSADLMGRSGDRNADILSRTNSDRSVLTPGMETSFRSLLDLSPIPPRTPLPVPPSYGRYPVFDPRYYRSQSTLDTSHSASPLALPPPPGLMTSPLASTPPGLIPGPPSLLNVTTTTVSSYPSGPVSSHGLVAPSRIATNAYTLAPPPSLGGAHISPHAYAMYQAGARQATQEYLSGIHSMRRDMNYFLAAQPYHKYMESIGARQTAVPSANPYATHSSSLACDMRTQKSDDLSSAYSTLNAAATPEEYFMTMKQRMAFLPRRINGAPPGAGPLSQPNPPSAHGYSPYL